ncbi:MAG: hypothetical protein WC683_17465 [bacterium]
MAAVRQIGAASVVKALLGRALSLRGTMRIITPAKEKPSEQPEQSSTPPSTAPDASTTPTAAEGDPVSTAAAHVQDSIPAVNTEAVERDAQDRDRKAREETEKDKAKARRRKPAPRSVIARTTDQEKADAKARETKAAFEARCRKSGEETIDSIVLGCTTLMGPEWWYDPPTVVKVGDQEFVNDEQARLRQVWGDTFVHYGWASTPSWLGLAVSTGGYIAVRVNRPKTKERIQSWKEKLVGWWARRKVRKEAERREREEREKAAKQTPPQTDRLINTPPAPEAAHA